MRSIFLHSLSLGTSMFPLDQLGSKHPQHRLSFRKTARVWGALLSYFSCPLLPASLPTMRKPGAMWWQQRKHSFADLTPVSTVTVVQRPWEILFRLNGIFPNEGSFHFNMKFANCRQWQQTITVFYDWNLSPLIFWPQKVFDSHISLAVLRK